MIGWLVVDVEQFDANLFGSSYFGGSQLVAPHFVVLQAVGSQFFVGIDEFYADLKFDGAVIDGDSFAAVGFVAVEFAAAKFVAEAFVAEAFVVEAFVVVEFAAEAFAAAVKFVDADRRLAWLEAVECHS